MNIQEVRFGNEIQLEIWKRNRKDDAFYASANRGKCDDGKTGKGQELFIEVVDNGVGMEETLKKVEKKDLRAAESRGNIGLVNIHERRISMDLKGQCLLRRKTDPQTEKIERKNFSVSEKNGVEGLDLIL